MSIPRNILVVAHADMQPMPSLGRAACMAHLTGATIHLCLFAYDALIGDTDSTVHADVRRLARKEFLDVREHWLAERAASLREQGLKATAEVTWAPVLHEALVAKVLELRPDLVIKDMARDYDLPRWLHSPADWKVLRYCPAPLMLVAPDSASHPRHIAVAVDAFQDISERSSFNDALVAAAQDMAHVCDARLDVVSAFPWILVPSVNAHQLGKIRNQARTEHHDAFTTLCERQHVAVDARHHLQGLPEQVLTSFVAEAKVDLLVLGSIYRKGFSRLVLGSTAETLLGLVHCDVLLIKPAGFDKELAQHLDLPALQRHYGGGSAQA